MALVSFSNAMSHVSSTELGGDTDVNLALDTHLQNFVRDVNDRKAIGVLLTALEIIEYINGKIHDYVTKENAETLSVMRDVLRGYWQCNEKTLALVGLLTTSRANLQDIFDRYKQAGREAQEHPEAIRKIKDWIAKAKELQQRESGGETETAADKLVDDMQKQIKRTMESYEKLLGNIDSAVNRLDSRKRGLVINYRLLVGVAAVACLGVVASVGFLTVSLPATTAVAAAAVGTAGFAAFFGTTVLTFKAIDWVDRVGKAIQNVGEALTALEDIKESGDGLVTQLQDITLEVESVERCIAQVERKLSDLDDTVQQAVILDHDQANLIQEHGRILVQKCDQMQQQFSLLEIQIERLRDQVLKAQHSRRRLRNERTHNLATPLMLKEL